MDNKQGGIIQAVEQCLRRNGCSSCENCPYTHVGDGFECREKLRDDIIALLKAQQPRVMTLKEVKDIEHDTVVWYEHIGAYPPRPRVVHYANDEHIMFSYGGDFRYCADEYGKHFRLWTSHPTDEQREAEAWS